MLLLAALLCVPLDLANEHIPWEWPLWAQAIAGGTVITAAEFAAGLVLNVWLGLGVWDYSALWCLLAGPVIVAFDWLCCWMDGGERPKYHL